MADKKVLGVLGGLGPMSSAYFYEMVTDLTYAEKDQDHLDIVISSRATTPDRTDFILGNSKDDPLPVMREEAQKLVNYGAGVLALTCNTAHYFYEALQESIPVPLLNIAALAIGEIASRGITKVGLLATTGTVNFGIYQQACEEGGIECIVPDEEGQKKVMSVIYDQVKCGKPVDMDMFNSVAYSLVARGAEIIILGCTELSVIKRTEKLTRGFIDPLEILAKTAITACGGKLK